MTRQASRECECGNPKGYWPSGPMKRACDRCMEMERGRYLTVLPPDKEEQDAA